MIALCEQEEHRGLNTDEAVIKALGRKPADHGSLTELIDKNRLPVEGKPKEIGVFLKQVGLEPEKFVKIEGGIKIGWSIKRIRVSPRYEIWLQGDFTSYREIFMKASVVPYSEKLFSYRITNREDWDNVVFTASEPEKVNETSHTEQPGASQPATQPADKVPAEVQPPTPPSQDGPR